VQERTRQLTASQERLRTLGSQLAVAEQRERQKLARDLHDYLAQMLSVGRMKMGLAKKQPELSPASVAVLQDIDAVFQQALTYTRTMIAELSPPSFRDYGLLAALKWLAERMEKDGLWVQVQTTCAQVPLSEEQAVLVFQCVRELLFNVLKHAGVSEATLRCAVDRGDVRVAVEDRGKGMDADALTRAAEPGHLGLFAVRERMEAMGGRLEIESAPGRGTTVTVVLPQVSIEQDSVER
jgi:signal transduction histidine kinase